ncbi:MAG: hypothetical protein HY894_09985 [Deltaproteobacteria bacterium]|nr:hypothetical protein [Deltaproteobacteria bacterium]
MIDIHCHILPAIDDGPAAVEESVEMCRMAASDGINTVVATPHFNSVSSNDDPARVMAAAAELDAACRREGIPLKVLAGADVSISSELPTYLKTVPHLTINRTGRYFLAEFPHNHVLPNWERFFLSLLASGFVPIITHPERNAWFMNNPDALFPVVAKGVMVQITAMSLTGEFGEDAQEVSLYLLRHNLAHVIATDAHSVTYRPPVLSEALSLAADLIGPEKARRLVEDIPSAIIEGKPIALDAPLSPGARKTGLF